LVSEFAHALAELLLNPSFPSLKHREHGIIADDNKSTDFKYRLKRGKVGGFGFGRYALEYAGPVTVDVEYLRTP